MPTSATAHNSRNSRESIMPARTPGRAETPHSARNGALEATAVLPSIAAATHARASSGAATRTNSPARASRRMRKLATRASMATSGMRNSAGGASGGGCPGAAAERGYESCAESRRAASAAPPQFAEAARRGRGAYRGSRAMRGNGGRESSPGMREIQRPSPAGAAAAAMRPAAS